MCTYKKRSIMLNYQVWPAPGITVIDFLNLNDFEYFYD